jgi:hypothetical protein
MKAGLHLCPCGSAWASGRFPWRKGRFADSIRFGAPVSLSLTRAFAARPGQDDRPASFPIQPGGGDPKAGETKKNIFATPVLVHSVLSDLRSVFFAVFSVLGAACFNRASQSRSARRSFRRMSGSRSQSSASMHSGHGIMLVIE